MKRSIITAAALAGVATLGVATSAQADDSITMNGVTIYGTIDLGLAYQTHGAPLSESFYPGLDYLISKASNRSIFSLAPNGMSQSKLGVKGAEEITPEFSGIFKFEAAFEPQSGSLADSSKSLVEQNGVPLANQTASADGNRQGQLFANAAIVGIQSVHYGTLTAGRQTSVLSDNIVAFDPQGAAFAFSLIGFSGTTQGAGYTQDVRLDNSIKYVLPLGPVHLGGTYQFATVTGVDGGAYEGDVGFEFMGLSVDGLYSHITDAVKAGSLSAAQLALPTTYPGNSLTAQVSDNSAYTIDAKYVYGPVKIYGGYENIRFVNPAHPQTTSFDDEGYFVASAAINNTAFTAAAEVLQVYWAGLKYSILPNLDITGAWYHYNQNSYKGNGCSDNSAGSCSGQEDAYSGVVDYRITKRFDIYAGAMFSTVQNGLANGYLKTKTIDPMVGGRFNF